MTRPPQTNPLDARPGLQGVPPVRDRCAGRGCEHARSRHDQEGRCLVCDRCRGWAESRPHWWREYVTETYWHARNAWEVALDLEANTTWTRGLVSRERRKERRGGRREVTDHIESNPPPTFRDHLIRQGGQRLEAS